MAAVVFTSNVEAFIEQMRKAVADGLKDVAKEIQDDAVSLAPVRKVTSGQKAFRSFRRYKAAGLKEISSGTAMFGGTKNFKVKPFSLRFRKKNPYMQRVAPMRRRAEYEASLSDRTIFISEKGKAEGGNLNWRGRYEVRNELKGAFTAESVGKLKVGEFVSKKNALGEVISRNSVSFAGFVGGKRTFEVGGYLRKNIVVGEVEAEGGRTKVSVVSKAPYSRYVEFPTRRTKAQPFMMPAIKQAKRGLKRAMKDAVRAGIKQG
jgi:HK97 gp10 family phage protein